MRDAARSPSVAGIFVRLQRLPEQACKKTNPQLVLERALVAFDRMPHQAPRRTKRFPEQRQRQAHEMARTRTSDAGFGLLEIEAAVLTEDGAADAVPVEPSPEILLLEAVRDDDVIDDHLRQIEPPDTRRARAQVPLTLCLIAQRAGPAAETAVEQSNRLEYAAPIRDVDAERPRNAPPVLERLRTVVLQPERFLINGVAVRQPPGPWLAPERTHRP